MFAISMFRIYILTILMVAFLSSCKSYNGVNLTRFKTDMTTQIVLNILKKDSDLVYWAGLKGGNLCRGDIFEYGNWKKYQWRKSPKRGKINPHYKKEDDKMHYWFVFFNDSL